MPKVVISDAKGLVQSAGAGLGVGGALYSGNGTTTAAATSSAPTLPEGIVNTVDSANNAHRVLMPKAHGAGQLMVIRNVDSGQDVVIRNNANGSSLVTLGEGKTAIMVSTAAGDNWAGSQVD